MPDLFQPLSRLSLILAAALSLAAPASARAQIDPLAWLSNLPDLTEAEALAELAVLRAQPVDTDYVEQLHDTVADTADEVGFDYPPRYRLQEGLLDWRAELAMLAYGPESLQRAEALFLRADLLALALYDPAAALPPAEGAVAILRANPDELAPLAEHLVSTLANVHSELGRPDLAVPLRREALAILEAEPGTHPRGLGLRQRRLAQDLAAAGTADDAEVEDLLRAALAGLQAVAEADDFEIVNIHVELGGFLTARGRTAEGAVELDAARRIVEAKLARFPGDPGRLIPQLSNLARIEIAAGNPDGATAHFLRIAVMLQEIATDDPEDAQDLARGVLNDLRWNRIDHPAAAALAASWPDL